MRRFMSSLLVGVGVFVLIAAALLKFYAYPKLAVAPKDQNSVTSLSATGATIFDTNPAVLSEVTTDLTVKSTTKGDVPASESASDKLGRDVVVWAGTQTIVDGDGTVRSQSADRTAFDASTSEAVDCCDNFVEDEADVRTPVKRDGIVYKFPFGTGHKAYRWWDDSLGDTVVMKFVKETSIKGLDVLEFHGNVPETAVGTMDVPASVVGETGDGNVTADKMYANERTFWVEPHTGVIINREEKQRSTLQVNGQERLVMTDADLSYTPAQVSTNVDDWSGKAFLLGLIDGVLPWLVMLLGVLLVVGGLLLGRRSRVPAGGGVSTPVERRSAGPEAATA